MAFSNDNNTLRQTVCNVYADAIDQGSSNGYLRIRNSTTTLVDLNFDDPAYGAATSADPSVASLTTGLSDTATGGSSTSPDNYIVFDSDDTQLWSGSCGVGSGDINFDGSITSGQTVSISTLPISQA